MAPPRGFLRVLATMALIANDCANAQGFVTSLTGLNGHSVGVTPVGTPGTSTMTMYSLQDIAPDAVCNGATCCFFLGSLPLEICSIMGVEQN